MTRPPHGDKRMDIFQRCFLDLDVSDGLYEFLSTSYRHHYMSPGQLVLGCIGGVDCKSCLLFPISRKSYMLRGICSRWAELFGSDHSPVEACIFILSSCTYFASSAYLSVYFGL